MRKVFEVELASENICTQLNLPAAPYALLDALEKLRLADGEDPRWEILRINTANGITPYLDHENGSLFELNALCQHLALLDEGQLAIVEGLAAMGYEKGPRPIPMPQLIDMAYSTDRCHFVEEATDDYTLGRFCAENGFVPEADSLPDAAFELLDFERIGRQFRESEGGVFTCGGYVQRREELKQVYKDLDLTLKKPDYTLLVETASGAQIKLPGPIGTTVVDEPAQCLDSAAPGLTGLTATLSTLDMLARRMGELEMDGELTKFKAVLEATGCGDAAQALTLADGLDRYRFDPELREPDEVASGRLKELLPEVELAALLPNVNLYRCGQAMVEESGGKLTGYGYIQPSVGPTQDMTSQTDEMEMTLS